MIPAKPVWCVRWKGFKGYGWCACKQNRKPAATKNVVPTLCEWFVTLPGGVEKRVPTCPDCLKILETKKARTR